MTRWQFIVYSTFVLTAAFSVSYARQRGSWIEMFMEDGNQTVVTVDGSTFFNFKIITCNDSLSIQLEDKSNTSSTSYNIAIGYMGLGKKKKRTGIEIYKDREETRPWAKAYGDFFLRCAGEYDSFWISWTDGDIKVGSGLNEREGELLLQKRDDRVSNVNAIVVTSLVYGYVDLGLQYLPNIGIENIRGAMLLTTDGTNHFIFEIKTCHDFELSLWDEGLEYQTIIHINYDGTGFIDDDYDTYDSPIVEPKEMILSCEEYKPFWVSWSKKMRKIGTGFVIGTDTLLRTELRPKETKRFNVKEIHIGNVDESYFNVPASRCPVGFWYHPRFESCYNFVYAKRFPYKSARSYCKRLGGYLAIVESQEESDYIQNMLDDDAEYEDFLLGGQRSKPKTTWVWKDHPEESFRLFNITDWRSGEPNNRKTERCIAININGWNDVQCSYGYQFICEAMPL